MVKPVMVLGGGIAGIQAASDLAEMGIPVYLVEKNPALGGKMAQLDKTFPTNDCSTCILAPKISDCYNHDLVTTLSYSEVEEISGKKGDFNVRVRQKARYIKIEDCTGCGDCAEACPVKVPQPFDEGLSERKAVYRLNPQAVPSSYTIEKKENPPCRNTCPAGVNVQGYMALTAAGKYQEAIDLIRQDNPLPGICGRVCTHPCEVECNRNRVDEPLAVREVKRFLADWDEGGKKEIEAFPVTKDGKIAVIGSGPAGLSAAYQLRRAGYQVTIFEKNEQAGGMLRYGIPAYRLPRDVLDKEIEIIEKRGVEIKTGVELGRDITIEGLKKDGYQAVFVAIGTQRGRKLNLEGEEDSHVLDGLEFLAGVSSGKQQKISGKVGVVGGGNTAIDAARTALRLGADKVQIIYRRSREQMPAELEEIEACLEEGIEIQELKNPGRLLYTDKRLSGVECVQMRLGDIDASGRRRPIPVEGEDVAYEVDWLINAIGQVPEGVITGLEEASNDRGWLKANPVTMATEIPGIFAGGDVIGQEATVIDAIGYGKKAAQMIDTYLEEGWAVVEALGQEEIVKEESARNIDENSPRIPRKTPLLLKVEERVQSFAEVEKALSEEEALTEAARCLQCSICSDCRECEKACEKEAINHEMEDIILEKNVGAVILASGYELFDPVAYAEYGYRLLPDVVTSLEFERISSASGPTGGHLKRPSDGRDARKIAFIHCSGSRDIRIDKNYCSSVCCMYSIKQALITREHVPEAELDLYYMDLRAFGKGFERYFNTAQATPGIDFVRSKVSDIEKDEKTGELVVKALTEAGEYRENRYDLVVLASGLSASPEVKELMERFKIRVNKYGFADVDELNPLATSREGILACGVISGPKDIPESVIQASGAAAQAAEIVRSEAGEIIPVRAREESYRFTDNEPLKIGVFICHCGTNIGGVVDVPAVAKKAAGLPFVEHAEDLKYLCSSDSQTIIAERIKEKGLNRLVVASCTPRTHELLFRGVAARAGINPYLTVMTNIRDQDSWVHREEPAKATEKAYALVSGAVAKSRKARSLERSKIEKLNSGIVIGGGVSGMTAALRLAEMGFPVNLIEKEAVLGGNALKLFLTMDGRPVAGYLAELAEKVESHPLIDLYLGYEVEGVSGYVGNYKLALKENNRLEKEVLAKLAEECPYTGEAAQASAASENNPLEVEGAVVIIATGAEESKAEEYLSGENPRVISQLELEERLKTGGFKETPERVFMIQCVGSREEGREYCSRVCCTQAVNNAIYLKERNPEMEITVFYREMRTYGLYEDKYRRARQLGVSFIRYDLDNKPQVEAGEDGLKIGYREPITGEEIKAKGDLLVLAQAITAGESNRELSQFLKVPLNEDGFFLEAHVKLRPVDFATDGVYLCGLAHGPKNLGESIAISNAAASRAATILAREYLMSEAMVAEVNQGICSGCGSCEDVCPYQAISVNEEKGQAEVNIVLCKGCGNCNSACRAHAVDLKGFSHQQLVDEMEAIFMGPESFSPGGIDNG